MHLWTDAMLIAISPEPNGQGIKSVYLQIPLVAILCLVNEQKNVSTTMNKKSVCIYYT